METKMIDPNTKTLKPKFHITNHHELRKRVQYDVSEPSLTDQSYKKSCDINNIMAQYAKTGMLPQLNTLQPKFIDNTIVPTLEESFSIVKKAQEAFFELPPTIRKLMDNDPSQLENFISDRNNADILIKHGILIQRETQAGDHQKSPKPDLNSSENNKNNTQVTKNKHEE